LYFTLIAIVLLSCANKKQGLYVSPNGEDTNIGSKSHPLKTVQKAVYLANPGETIFIREGIYREQVTIPAGKNKIRLLAFENDNPILKGSDLFTDWKEIDNYWYRIVKVEPQQIMVDGNNPLQQIGYPNDDFRDDQSYKRYEFPVGSGLADMENGRFFWSNDSLYISLKDGSNPNKHKIEVSQRPFVIRVEADSVNIEGIFVRHSNANTFVEQGTAVQLGNYSVIKNCDVQWCDFGGISMGFNKVGAIAINCNASNNGATGFNSSLARGFLISNCTANYNNYRNFYARWHTGGFKAASSAWGTVENSEFAYNTGPGIWFDYCFERPKYRSDGQKPIIIRNNFVHHNSQVAGNTNAAIFIEVTEMVDIYNNRIISNGERGIYVAASWDINIRNNVIAETKGYCAVDIAGMPRSGAKLKNVNFTNNIILNSTSKYDLHLIKEDYADVKNLISDYNLIFRKDSILQLWYSTDGRDKWQGPIYSTLKEWSLETGFDSYSINTDPKFNEKTTNYNIEIEGDIKIGILSDSNKK
jgi:parallel beta-helix repeat protein